MLKLFKSEMKGEAVLHKHYPTVDDIEIGWQYDQTTQMFIQNSGKIQNVVENNEKQLYLET